MPSAEPTTQGFTQGWTHYLVVADEPLSHVAGRLAPTTPPFTEPTHEVEYRLEQRYSEVVVTEQGDEAATVAGEAEAEAWLRSRIAARLYQIAGLAGWVPVAGAVVDLGDRVVLVCTAAGHQILDVGPRPPRGLVGVGTCLLRPERTAVVGRVGPAPWIRPGPAPTDVVVVDATEGYGGVDGAPLEALPTPAVIEHTLTAVVEPGFLPGSAAPTAARAVATARGWLARTEDLEATIRAVTDHDV